MKKKTVQLCLNKRWRIIFAGTKKESQNELNMENDDLIFLEEGWNEEYED